ncbi:MAG: hypothetical protein DRJ38_02170 [Thermoprotei archaeon]|nr:MAG: hypothetical protein DRJ38_02170 [Thermoprotei archaeon]
MASLALILLGFIFVIAAFSPGKIYRLAIGVPMVTVGGVLIYRLLQPKPKILTVTLKWDPSGKIVAEELKCPYCGAPLPPPQPGMEYLKCPYCGKTIKVLEEPIW